jgi:ABC-type amino acid transport substrate-binding protein
MQHTRRDSDIRRGARRGALRLAAATIIGLTACAALPGLDLRDTLARIAATPAAFGIEATPTPAPPAISTAALVKARSVLRVGIRFDAPPLASVNDQGELEGLDVDIAREFARRWLGSTRNVLFVQVTSNSAPRRIANREIDLALGGLAHTQSAEALADFSLAYFEDGEAVLARADQAADFAGLAGRDVAYVDYPSAEALGEAQIAAGITVTVRPAASYARAVEGLREGEFDGVAGRWRRLRLEALRDPALRVVAVLRRDPIAIMLPPNDSDWADLVNLTLSAMLADGWYAAAYQNWMGVPPPLLPALPGAVDLQLAALPDGVALPAAGGALARIRASSTLRVGFNAQAGLLATLGENSEPAGFEVDLARQLAQRWFQDAGAAQFTALPPDQAAASLKDGIVDVFVGGIPMTQANERLMDFSLPIYQGGLSLAVLATSGIQDPAALNGRRIGLAQGTIDRAALDEARRAGGLSFQDVPYPDLSTALGDLRAGQVDAVAADRITLLALASAAGDLFVLPARLAPDPAGLALPRNDSAWRDQVNLTLQQMIADGTYGSLYRRWFGDDAPAVEAWPGQATLDTALIAPTPTPLPTPTPAVGDFATPTPAPPTASP